MGAQRRKQRSQTRSGDDDQIAEVTESVGVPAFEHNQYTFEGEIERLGAFSTAAARSTGWKRVVALVVIVALVLPLVLGLVFAFF